MFETELCNCTKKNVITIKLQLRSFFLTQLQLQLKLPKKIFFVITITITIKLVFNYFSINFK